MTATATSSPTVKAQELMPHGLVESESVSSFADLVSSNLNKTELNKEKKINNFINTFICHLIFYAVFCISLVLYILIDLGLLSLVKNQFLKLIEIAKGFFVLKNLSFA